MNLICKWIGHRWGHYGLTSRCIICHEFYWGSLKKCCLCDNDLIFKNEMLKCSECDYKKEMGNKEYLEIKNLEYLGNGKIRNFFKKKEKKA